MVYEDTSRKHSKAKQFERFLDYCTPVWVEVILYSKLKIAIRKVKPY